MNISSNANINKSNAEFPFQRLQRRLNALPERLPRKNLRNLPIVLLTEVERFRGIARTYFVFVDIIASSLSVFFCFLLCVPPFFCVPFVLWAVRVLWLVGVGRLLSEGTLLIGFG